MINYIFFGTPEFAAIILKQLISEGFVPRAVVCNPDRPVGRKKIITAPPVKERIMNYESRIKEKIKILQPEQLDQKFHNSLFQIHNSYDFFIVASYANIIPKSILDIPRLGAIGVHPSLLPKYRGASPIQSAILGGESETGITLYLMDEKMDHGPILANAKWKNQNGKWNYIELQKELANLAGNLLIKTLPRFLKGELSSREQDHSQATFTKKFTAEDGFIPEHNLGRALRGEGTFATVIDRKIRALNPEPGIWTIASEELRIMNNELRIPSGKRVKLLEAKIRDAKLVLIKIQEEGKKVVSLK